MADLALIAALVAAAALGALLAAAFFRRDWTFWPPPRRESWQFRLSFGLFRAFCAATILHAALDWGSLGWTHWSRWAIGLPLTATFLVTLRGYLLLGIENTYGARDGLVTGGLYAYSRNPQYVTSVLATLGLGITAGSGTTLVLAAVLFALYTLFALNEERWLSRSYGESFRAYMRAVPRFLDARSLLRARREIAKAL